MMSRFLFFILLTVILLTSANILVQEAEAIKSIGNSNPTINSNAVCGIKLCNVQQSIEEKIIDYLFELSQKDSSVIPQGRFSIGGIGSGLFQQSIDQFAKIPSVKMTDDSEKDGIKKKQDGIGTSPKSPTSTDDKDGLTPNDSISVQENAGETNDRPIISMSDIAENIAELSDMQTIIPILQFDKEFYELRSDSFTITLQYAHANTNESSRDIVEVELYRCDKLMTSVDLDCYSNGILDLIETDIDSGVFILESLNFDGTIYDSSKPKTPFSGFFNIGKYLYSMEVTYDYGLDDILMEKASARFNYP